MKKLLYLSVFLILAAGCASSAGSPFSPSKAPLDPAVRSGILPNGLTYYLLANPKPEKRASLRLVIRAGSIQETESQRGLAHFTEHMAFNGSTHFDKNALIDYFETIGMDFGHDLNAYTSFEETVYMLEVPTDKPEIMAQSLLVLQDWLSGLTFDPVEVDKERGVVQEEWRLGRNAETRRFETQWPLMSGGSLYADRLPIGQMDIIRNAPAGELKNFYLKWYRPPLAALVAVGDFDPEVLEKDIRGRFSGGSPSQPEVPPLPPLPLPTTRTVQLFSDPELSYNLVQILRLKKSEDLEYRSAVREKILSSLTSSAMNTRFSDLTRAEKPPFIQAQWSEESFVSGTRGLTITVVPGLGQFLTGLEAALREVQKARTAGFSLKETEREKAAFLAGLDQAYAQRKDLQSASRAQGLVEHFLRGEAFPADDLEYTVHKEVLASVVPDDLNRYLARWMEGEGELVLASGTAKEDNPLPRESEFEASIRKIRAEVFQAEEEKAPRPLMSVLPAPGQVVKTEELKDQGITSWTLSNGAVVYFKPTDFKAEEVLLQGLSRGGSSLVTDGDYLNAQLANVLLSESGLGELDQEELNDVLSDKQVSLRISLEDAAEVISGSSSRKDLETFFQLLHLKMTAPRKDPQAFNSVAARIAENLRNRLQDPQQVFSDEIQRVLTGDHFRGRPLTPERMKEVDLDRVLEVYRRRFSNGGDFTFFLVGDADPQEVRRLSEKYLASLPSQGSETSRDLGIRPFKAPFRTEVAKGMEPRSQVVLLFPNEGLLDPEDLVAMDALKDILEIRLREAIREERGGTYGVQAGFSYRREPFGGLRYFISFGCAPDRIEELRQAALAEMEKLRAGIFVPTDLDKVKEIRRRNLETNLKTNGFWLGQMISYLHTIRKPEKMLDFQGRIDRLSPEILTPLAKKYMDPQTMLQLVLTQGER